MKGLVIKSTGNWYKVLDQKCDNIYEARIRGKFKSLNSRLTNPLAVGDFVTFSLETKNIAWITHIENRKNYLIRKSVNLSKQAHIIASNVDIACILFTVTMPKTSLGFLDRFLVCCEAYDIRPIIIFNKIDLLQTQEQKIKLENISNSYNSIGYDTVFVSSVLDIGIDEIKERIKGQTSVFFGHSGSGKSTLINTLNPNLKLKTGEISDTYSKGKHTTTFAQMFFWDFDGKVIDTPGVKEFAMIDVKKNEIQHYFPDIFGISNSCKFHNCLHINEPECKVIELLESNNIIESRYASYIKLMNEAEGK